LCRANNCNNQTIANLIKKAVKDYYNLSAVYEALKVKIEEDLDAGIRNKQQLTFY
jgi:hypothetical protein